MLKGTGKYDALLECDTNLKGTIMSLSYSGLNTKARGYPVTIFIEQDHPLVELAQVIPWQEFADLIIPDLQKSTKKGMINLGRTLRLRSHLGAFLLKIIFDLTDRDLEYAIKDNAAYQIFCGSGVVKDWETIDHTSIEKFRNRIGPETQRQLSNRIGPIAVRLGFADPAQTEIDSTVQEANASYPADANLMTKLSKKAHKVLEWLKETGNAAASHMQIELKQVMSAAKEYFFCSKNTLVEKKREIFAKLHREVKNQIHPFLELVDSIDPKEISSMPWNIKKIFDQIAPNGKKYLRDVAHFIRTHTIKKGKLLAWHVKEFSCIKKGKVGKDKEFGRVFQIGRIIGNFLFVGKSTSIRMEDAASLLPMVEEHGRLFGAGKIQSLSTDKKYFSQENIDALEEIKDLSLGYRLEDMSEETFNALMDHRAGSEALIGQTKHGGQLAKSRMKSDKTTLAAGYTAVGGFNLRQIIRHQKGKMKKVS